MGDLGDDTHLYSMSDIENSPSIAASFDSGALLEFSQILNTIDDPAAIYSNVLLALMGKMGLSSGAVATLNGAVYKITITKGRGSKVKGLAIDWRNELSAGLHAICDLGESESNQRLLEEGLEFAMPISFSGELLAVIILGRSLTNRAFGAPEESYAQLIAGIAAIAVDGCRARNSLSDANRRLKRRIHRLRSLFEASREFNTLLAPDAILRLLGFSLMGEMAIRRFAVAICDAKISSTVVNRFPADFPPELLDAAADDGPRIVAEHESNAIDQRFYALGVRAVIPMEVQGKTRGLLLVGERLHAPIDSEDLEYLASLSNLAVGALENMRLLEEIIVKQRMEEDLRIAADIQKGLLPSALPVASEFGLAARTIPTHQVGGDFYDAITLDDGRILIAIADVSGKGTPASLLMANIQAAIRALSGIRLDLADMVARINNLLYRNTASDKFVTAFFGILDPSRRTLSYVNAGHNPPFLFHDGVATPLEQGGLLLGIMPSVIPYDVGEVVIEMGDLLLLYTDGVSEALNRDHEEFGEERLKKLFASNSVPDAGHAIDMIRDAILEFTDGAPQSDDITAVVVRGE